MLAIMPGKGSNTSANITEQSGVNAVEAIFLSMGWLFRRQLESDFGIDAQTEVVVDRSPTGQLLALQIKSGPSYFRKRGKDFVYYGEQRHLDYWDRHSLPVLLVLHNPMDGVTLWQRVERHLVTDGENGSWSIAIPEWQTLSDKSADAILNRIPRSDPESDRRRRMALDAELVRQVATEGSAYVVIDEWQNKSLNFRSASVSFEEHDADPAYAVDFYLPGSNPSEVFDWLFPWLSFSYADVPEDDSSGEILVHVFEVKLNDLGKAFLMLEDYYLKGADPSPPAEIGEPTGEVWDEAKLDQYRFEEAQRADWEAEAQLPPDEGKK